MSERAGIVLMVLGLFDSGKSELEQQAKVVCFLVGAVLFIIG